MAGLDYVPLFCKSNFSFLEGASHPDELIEEAQSLGIRALALVDRDGLYGAVRAHVCAKKLGFKLILGSQVTIDDGTSIVLLARDRAGYSNLCRLITRGRRRSAKGESQVRWREVCEHASGLCALWGGREAAICAPSEPDEIAGELRDAFGEFLFALLTRHREAEDVPREARLRQRARRYHLATVAAVETLYHS